MYELMLHVKKKGGNLVDPNTDCFVCELDKFPFKLDDSNNIIGYYHDQEHLTQTYTLEEGTSRVKHSKLQRYVRRINTNMNIIIAA